MALPALAPPAPCSPRRAGRSARAPRGRRLVWLLVAVLVLGFLPSAPGGAQEGPSPDDDPNSVDANGLKDEYEAVLNEEAELLTAFDKATKRLEELLPKVEKAQVALRDANLAALVAKRDLDAKRVEAANAEQRLEDARERVSSAKERLREYAVDVYMGDSGSSALRGVFDVLDGQRGSLARQGYRSSVDERQGQLINELINARRQRDRATRSAHHAENAAEAQSERVERLRAKAKEVLDETTRLARQAQVEQTRQALLVADIQSRKVSIEARIISLEKAADGVANVLAAYQADDPDWVAGAVDVRIPIKGAQIGSEFGMRAHPILHITRLHAGADIGATMGEPVMAAADGVVVLAEPRGGYGNTVVIAHGHSLGTVYAHNSSITVKVGDHVLQGQEIARAGSTGLSTGPHCHFETRLKGVPVNPRNFLLPGDASIGLVDSDDDGTPDRLDPDPDDPDITIEDFLQSLAANN